MVMGQASHLQVAPEAKRARGAARENKWNRVAVVQATVAHFFGPKHHGVVQQAARSQWVTAFAQ